MVRVYIADLKVQQKLNKLFKENDKEFTNFGLVIGQVCNMLLIYYKFF